MSSADEKGGVVSIEKFLNLDIHWFTNTPYLLCMPWGFVLGNFPLDRINSALSSLSLIHLLTETCYDTCSCLFFMRQIPSTIDDFTRPWNTRACCCFNPSLSWGNYNSVVVQILTRCQHWSTSQDPHTCPAKNVSHGFSLISSPVSCLASG